MVETFIINPLECNHAPVGVNSFKGGHDHDQVSRDSQAKKFGTQSAEHCRQLQCLQENGQSCFEGKSSIVSTTTKQNPTLLQG